MCIQVPITCTSTSLSSMLLLHKSSLRRLSSLPSRLTIGEKQQKQVRCQQMRSMCDAQDENRLTMSSECTKQIPPQDLQESKLDEINERVKKVKKMLSSMNDGEISSSAYDSAWVALVKSPPAADGTRKPQFPTSLEWISRNQLEDGSWGDPNFFQAHDRLLNTLACLIALTSWGLHPHMCHKGMKFMRENMRKLGHEKEEHMPIGFEVIFPKLIEMARGLDLHLPLDVSGLILQDIYTKRSIKISRIPKEIMHRKPTTLLFSLEGMEELDWEQLMSLQSKNGSFLFSPASTAYALAHTKDLQCFAYLQDLVCTFNGGVPFSYPIDMLEHIWAVDRLQRLGVSRYFEAEIRACLDYVYRYWTKDGIFSARESEVVDIDDTCMGFRLLRLHGYNVSADVLKHFKKEDEFFCFPGQSTESVTVMLNLYRASQLQFPGETILEEAKQFCWRYLTRKRASNHFFDKWVFAKDLPGEVAYALDLPWYASLPRIETRFYIEQYGGEDDVWIGKTLYRMPYVSNNTYLELAKLDYNACQAIHLQEWRCVIRRWYIDCNAGEFGLRRRELSRLYFVAAASIFEPERWLERQAWAKTWAVLTSIATYFRHHAWVSYEQRRIFVDQFLNSYNSSTTYGFSNIRRRGQVLLDLLLGTLNQLYLDVLEAHGVDIRPHLRQAWEKWMVTWAEEGDEYKGAAELIARTIHACSNSSHLQTSNIANYNALLEIANKVCHQLGHLILQNDKHANPQVQKVKGSSDDHDHDHGKSEPVPCEVNSHMQKLVELVLSNDQTHGTANPEMKHIILAIARGYYYSAYCSPNTIDSHAAKVLFKGVA